MGDEKPSSLISRMPRKARHSLKWFKHPFGDKAANACTPGFLCLHHTSPLLFTGCLSPTKGPADSSPFPVTSSSSHALMATSSFPVTTFPHCTSLKEADLSNPSHSMADFPVPQACVESAHLLLPLMPKAHSLHQQGQPSVAQVHSALFLLSYIICFVLLAGNAFFTHSA